MTIDSGQLRSPFGTIKNWIIMISIYPRRGYHNCPLSTVNCPLCRESHPQAFPGFQRLSHLTKYAFPGYNNQTIEKSCEEKSRLVWPVREPRELERGTEGKAEHGLGAGESIGRLFPGAPVNALLRQRFSAKQGGTASVLSPLDFSGGGVFIYKGGFSHVQCLQG